MTMTRSRKTRLASLVLACGICGAETPAKAKLAHSSLTRLIDDSTLIVEASPIAVRRTGYSAGRATLKVLRVLKGTYDKAEVTITWGDEVHDQQIATIAFDRLLFLRRTAKGRLVGTQYGRSYWPLTSRVHDVRRAKLDAPSRGFNYRYPLSMVRFGKAQRTLFDRSRRSVGPRHRPVPFVSLLKLKQLIASRSRQPKR